MPMASRRVPKVRVTSAASAFIGATYTILNSSLRSTPSRRCCPNSRSTAIIAMLVLPAPVGAHTSMFSLLNIPVCMRACMGRRVVPAYTA